MRRSILLPGLCVVATCSLAGCGEMVFKRGADPGSMASTQAACRAKTDDEPAYIACMEQQGYVVKGSAQSVFVSGADEPAAGTTGGGKPSSFFVEGTAPAPAAPVAKAPAAKPAAPAAPAAAAAVVPATVAPAAVAPKPAVAAVDPLELVDVASWWKLGGSASGLEAAQADCVAKLGNAHRPVPDSTQVTRGLIGCLRDAGWRGIGR